MGKEIVTSEDVEHIAKLSRIEFSEAEKVKIQEDLNMIVGYCDILNSVEGDAEIKKQEGHLREDEARLGLSKSDVVKNAPVHNDSSFIVPKVVE